MSIELQSRARRTSGQRAPGDRTVEPPARTTVSSSTVSAAPTATVRAHPYRRLPACTLRAEHGELLAVVGPSGCGKTTLLELICGLQAPDSGAVECAPAALMPQRDLLLPWLTAVDNAALALRIAGRPRAEARAQRRGAVRRARLARIRVGPPARALRRHAPARGVPAHVALRQARPLPRRAVRRARRDHARGDAGLAGSGSWQREPRTVVLVTHDVEEAVVLADRVAVLTPRPGRLRAEIVVDLPRPRSRTDAAVVARERLRGSGAAGSARGRLGTTGRGTREAPRRQRPSRDRARRGAARRVGDLRRLGRYELVDPARRRTRSRKRCGATPACSATTSRSPPRRSCSDWCSRWRSASCSAC